MEDKDIESLKQQIEQREKEIELEKEKAYAQAVGTQQVKEVSVIAQDINKTLETKLNNKLAEKLNIKQSTETTSDGSTVIRFDNLMFIYKAFLIAGNTEQVYTFPYQFDNGSPICWCNNTASRASASNSCAVTESSSLSMKVRVCGVESSVTLFAIG